MKHRIAYIELDTHAEVLNQFYELTAASDVLEVDFYVSPKIKSLLGNSLQQVNVVEPHQLLEAIKQQSYELIILGTVHRYFSTFLKVVKNFKSAIVVHNVNFSETPKHRLLNLIFKDDFVFRTKLLLKEGLLLSPDVYQLASFLLVLDQNMTSENRRHLPLYYMKKKSDVKNAVPKMVIPGAVSQKRRDYDKVIAMLQHVEKPLEVYFLGKAQGAELEKIKSFVRSKKVFLKVHYYNQKLSQNDFQHLLSEADILWCPIQTETSFFSQTEIYGKTKSSGNIGDAITFGKLAVFPPEYAGKLPFVISETSDFIEDIEDIVRSKPYNFEQDYSFEIVKNQLENVVLEMIRSN